MICKILIAALLMTTCLTACQPSKDAYRKDFVKGCVNSYAKDSTVANTEGRKYVEEYCNCMGDKLNSKMSADQWRTFNKSGDTSMSQFKAVLEPCTGVFKQKVSTIKR
jgi:hypothetical protein